MKKFLQQPINFAYAAIVMMTLTLGIGFATASYTLPGGNPLALIHAGGAEQPINNLKIGGSCTGGSCATIGTFDVRGLLNAVSFFGDTGTNLFFGFGDMYTLGTLYIGTGNNSSGTSITASPQIAIWNAPVNGLSAPLQKVNVSGNVRATNLNNSGGLPEVCVTQSGVLELCPQPSPIHGVCGPAEDSSHSSAPTTGLCSAGTPSTVTEGMSTWDWYCYGSNGGDTDTCSAPKEAAPLTYAWFMTAWGPCNGAGGSCDGTPTQGQGGKVDWNGMPFNWQNGKVYGTNAQGNPMIITDCLTNPGHPDADNFDLSSGKDFDMNASNTGIACYLQAQGVYQSVMYEPSLDTGYWHRVNVNPGAEDGPGNSGLITAGPYIDNPLYETGQAYRARCDMNSSGHLNPAVPGFPSGGPVDEFGFCNLPANPPSSNELQIGTWQAIQDMYCATARAGTHAKNLNHPAQGPGAAGMNVPIPPAPSYSHLYMQGYACVDQGVITCSGQNQNQCNAISGCTWQNIPGTQERIVECREVETMTHVSDSYCLLQGLPKPPTSQPCG